LATMMVVTETTGDKVKRLREDLSLSQRELAALAGVSPATVLKIEQGGVEKPHPRTLRKLAEALDVAPRDLRAD
jgi:transcriptional regulator with XRE-family HTH domain